MWERRGARVREGSEERGEGEGVGAEPVAGNEAREECHQPVRRRAGRRGGAENEVGQGGRRRRGGGGALGRGGGEEEGLCAGEVGGGGGEGEELGEEEALAWEAVEDHLRVELVERAAGGEASPSPGGCGGGGAGRGGRGAAAARGSRGREGAGWVGGREEEEEEDGGGHGHRRRAAWLARCAGMGESDRTKRSAHKYLDTVWSLDSATNV